MRAIPLGSLVVLLLSPAVLAGHNEGIALLQAELASVFLPTETLGARWDLTFTLRNDGDERPAHMALHDVFLVEAFGEWADDPTMMEGETRTFHTRIDLSRAIPLRGPSWFCLGIGMDWPAYEWPPSRCWSVLYGVALPDGVYPDDIEHPLLPGAPYGDLE